MKPELITEAAEPQAVELFEAKTDKGLTKFRAVVTKTEHLNRNGRVYRKAIFERELPKAIQENNRSDRIGMVDHPSGAPKVGDLGIRWLSFSFDGNDVIGEGEFLPTPRGQELEALVRAGVLIGFSSRGTGTFSPGEFNGEDAAIINDDYQFITFDAVVQPSVVDARISAYEHQRRADVLERLEAILEKNPDALGRIIDQVCADSALVEDEQVFYEDEEGLVLEAKWTTKYVDSLPDSSFLYVKGDVRKFPYKDDKGNIDLPHLRNALARIPDSGIPDDEKAALTKKAQDILAKAEGKNEEEEPVTEPAQEATNEEPATEEAETQDPAPAQEGAAEASEPVVEEAPEVNPLQERVTTLETELQEAQAKATTLEAQVTSLNEDAASLTALLLAINTALRAELDDQDWDDAALLANFAQCVACRRGDEAAAELAGSPDAADESTKEPSALGSLQDGIPALLKEYRTARVHAHIAKITRPEKWGRAIAAGLEEVAHSIQEADELLPDIRKLVEAKMNAAPTVATRGAVETTSRWTPAQLEERRLAGIED